MNASIKDNDIAREKHGEMAVLMIVPVLMLLKGFTTAEECMSD